MKKDVTRMRIRTLSKGSSKRGSGNSQKRDSEEGSAVKQNTRTIPKAIRVSMLGTLPPINAHVRPLSASKVAHLFDEVMSPQKRRTGGLNEDIANDILKG